MRWFVPFLILFLAGCPKGGDLPSPGPAPAPGYIPSAELQQLVFDVVPISEPKLAEFYGDFADVLARDSDSKIISTTGQFRTLNERAGRLAFQKTGLQGKYPDLGIKLNDKAATFLGLQNGPLDRQKAIDFLKSLEWALQ